MATTYLNKTLGTPTNNKIWTFSAWVKRSRIDYGNYPNIFCANTLRDCIRFLNGDNIQVFFNEAGSGNLETRAKFRDVNAWYHIVVAVDTTQATSSNRVKIYVNGEQITSFATESYPAQNYTNFINSAIEHSIGKDFSYTEYFDGSMTHIHFIDGTQYQASDFGETDSTTGIWKPKTQPSVTYGNNGFFLKMENSASMGTDSSGNSNNFTVASGTLTQTIDTPSNVFATLNPLVRNKSYNDGTLTNGNLGFAPNGRAITCSTLGVTSGKYYAEFKATDAGGIYLGAGLMKGITSQGQTNPIWYDNTTGYVIAIANNGTLQAGSSTSASYGPTFADNDIIGIALDMDNKEMYIHKNGTYMNSGDPTSGASKTGGVTGALSYNPFDDGEEVFFMVADISAGGVGECQCNFGNGYFGTTAVSSAQNPDDGIGIFEYDVPAGYRALCTKSINAEEYS